MNNRTYQIAAEACKDVYYRHVDLGTTEFNVSWASNGKEFIQVLAIAGSNERKDWLINFNLCSWKGIKYGAYAAAHEIMQYFNRDFGCKLLVTGHSKAGATAIAFKRLFNADYCVAFAPARSLRYWTNREMENTTIFVDPDDPVHQVGFLSFGHPKCKRIDLPNNYEGLHVMDHHIDNFIGYINDESNPIT